MHNFVNAGGHETDQPQLVQAVYLPQTPDQRIAGLSHLQGYSGVSTSDIALPAIGARFDVVRPLFCVIVTTQFLLQTHDLSPFVGALSPAVLRGKAVGMPLCATESIAASRDLNSAGRSQSVVVPGLHHVKRLHRSHRECQGGLRNYLLWS